MGRAGIEPATLGLKVDVGLFKALGSAGRTVYLNEILSGCLGRSSVVLLTLC